MSVQKRSKGYTVRWRDAAGVQHSQQVTLWRDAVTLDGELKRRRAMGELIAHEKGKITLDEFWRIWWKNYALPNLQPATLSGYSVLWTGHISPGLGALSLRDLTPESVTGWISKLPRTLSAASIRKCRAILHGVLARAVSWSYISANPVTGVKAPRLSGERRGRALTAAQVEALTTELGLRSATVVRVLAATGLRPGELRRLKWGDCGAATLDVYAPKTNRRRTVDLRAAARSALVEWFVACGQPGDGALVFPGAGGGPWTDNGYRLWVKQTFKPAAARAGLTGIRPYDLRHTFVTTLIYEGRPPHEVARQAGHSVVVCMTTYAHEFESVRAECASPVADALNFRARLGI